MTEDIFVDRNQFRGDPTLDGVSEDGTSLSSLTSFFGALANTYSTVKGALDNQSANPQQVAKQSVGATSGGFKNYALLIGLSVAALVVIVLVIRK